MKILHIFLLLIFCLCLVVPAMAVDNPPLINYVSNGDVRWTNQAGTTITSGYTGDVVKFAFTVDDPAIANGSLDMLTIRMSRYNDQTGSWDLYDLVNVYGVFGNSTYAPIWGFNSGYYMNHTPVKCYANFTLVDGYSRYRVHVGDTSLNGTSPYGYYLYEWSNETITVSDNPIAFTNFGDWIKSIGGEGLGYLFAVIIIIIFILLPFLLMRTFNLYIELFMVAFAVVISLFLNLIDLWVVFGLGIGSLAIYLLINKTGTGGG